MKKREKFVMLAEFYSSYRTARVYRERHKKSLDQDDYNIYTKYVSEANMIRLLIEKFYSGDVDNADYSELVNEEYNLERMAEDDAEKGACPTEKKLFERFERLCIDDDEEEPA